MPSRRSLRGELHAARPADAKVRRELLRNPLLLRRASARATPTERREIFNLLCIGVGLRTGRAPAPKWRTAEALARDVS